MEIDLDTQAVEQGACVGFGGVAAFFTDGAFEFAEAHTVGVSQLFVRLGVEGVALLQRFPESGVAHDDGIDHAKFVESELILAEDAHLFGAGDGALGGLEFAGQDLHQGGFARAVRTGNAITATRHECSCDVLEEDARTETHGYIVDGQHNPPSIAGTYWDSMKGEGYPDGYGC
jgi:hypothetical protein